MPVVKVVPGSSEPLVCILFDDDDDGPTDFAVISADRKGFGCLTCPHGKHTCSHVKLVESLVKEDPIPDCLIDIVEKNSYLQSANRNIYIKKTLSKGKISWKTTDLQRSVFNGTLSDVLEEFSAGSTCCIPDFPSDSCDQCGSPLSEELFWTKGVKLLTCNGIIFVGGT